MGRVLREMPGVTMASKGQADLGLAFSCPSEKQTTCASWHLCRYTECVGMCVLGGNRGSVPIKQEEARHMAQEVRPLDQIPSLRCCGTLSQRHRIRGPRQDNSIPAWLIGRIK